MRKEPLQRLKYCLTTKREQEKHNPLMIKMKNSVPWLLPQPFVVKEIIPGKRLAWYHPELSHNPSQVQEQKGELQLLQPIFASQQHIHHMAQLFHLDSWSNCPQSNQHPATNVQYKYVILNIPKINKSQNYHVITYHHWRFNAFNKFTIAIVHHDWAAGILHLYMYIWGDFREKNATSIKSYSLKG